MHSEHHPLCKFLSLQEGASAMQQLQPNLKFSWQLNPETWTQVKG
jgi:hypothetical protein